MKYKYISNFIMSTYYNKIKFLYRMPATLTVISYYSQKNAYIPNHA